MKKQKITTVQSYNDYNFLTTEVGTIVEYPDNSKEIVIFKATDIVPGHSKYYLTQLQTQNIRKNGELGKILTWLKFRHGNYPG